MGPSPPRSPCLAARAVEVTFSGLCALAEVDLSLEPNEIVGLIGPNGAGKTTLLNVLSGFQKPVRGTVVLDGATVSGRSAAQLARKGVGRTFQGARLFASMSVRQNIELGAVGVGAPRREVRERVRELLARADLVELAETRAGSLPYGAQRRVGLARTLAMRPTFLLLDEPAAGLNEGESDQLVATLAGVRADFGCGVLIVEHDMRVVASLCDRLQVLDHGRTLAEGTPSAVLSDPDVVAAYLGGPAHDADA